MSGDFAFMIIARAPQYSAGRPGFADNDDTV
jgi:hypothetical protein